ncbi:unnamed protein product [Angiostrongylus costaricensis]|uniref:Glucuronosyltransferase n=1 Tax=Angiostrongylus costaricensis TaxID=334426 RepID=A0A0R3PBJ1_ANGCS|nr:unnamed protein product [Angiostrongylus costaricensis]
MICFYCEISSFSRPITMKQLLWPFLFFGVSLDAGKILVYSPSYSYSHLISNGRIADTLVSAGHDVVILSEAKIFYYLKSFGSFVRGCSLIPHNSKLTCNSAELTQRKSSGL